MFTRQSFYCDKKILIQIDIVQIKFYFFFVLKHI